ncbi:MAG: hypothetical protein WAT09_12195 [Paracoccaceae bacterium]
MRDTELMYDIPSILIALSLFVLIYAIMHAGRKLGKRRQAKHTEDSKQQANAVQGSLIGLLALLLGFTFSLSLGRFDQRSVEVVNEANAIGTAWLRTDLLAKERSGPAKDLMRQYAGLRLETATVSAADGPGRDRLIASAEMVFAALWQLATDEAKESGNPVSMGFVTSLNDMADALSARNAAINRHVPEIVLFLLFGTFLVLSGVIGYSSGITTTKPGVPVYSMLLLIVVLVFLIIDLDRPRRGLIAVDQSALAATVAAMQP